MFLKDQSEIQNLVWSDSQYMYRALLMTRLSIRKPFERVKTAVNDVVHQGPDMWSNTQVRRSCEELSLLTNRLLREYSSDDGDSIFRESLTVYGIGLAKAGFIAQLLTGTIGCLDTHNLKLYGLDINMRTDGSYASVQQNILTYYAACVMCGGSEVLWDNWCAHLARIRPAVWPTAESVSRYHVQIVEGK